MTTIKKNLRDLKIELFLYIIILLLCIMPFITHYHFRVRELEFENEIQNQMIREIWYELGTPPTPSDFDPEPNKFSEG